MMINKNADALQGDGGVPDPSLQPANPDHQLHSIGNSTIIKSGPLLLSSRGIGWTSWKKRWFILTRTSLVFFKSDPNAQKGNEVNLTLGGIDLNNSGSVVVRADKKLLTVLFPDGREGRVVTLKAETVEDLNEWKIALENALAQAPSPVNVTGQNGGINNEQTDSKDRSLDQLKDKETLRSKVIGQPILLALEDVDGAPTFLEKGLRFIEEHGVKVEGILRQAADVADVESRVREYEQGKVDFSAEEDAHVIADCVKHVLRGLPSSPVPASCCKALLEACRAEGGARRVSAMRAAICETFPEPNRQLLQRILMMMQAIASHKAENRMSSAAVAACMAPLLLRALFEGECEIESNFDVGGDGSLQLLQAAAAANHAQVIVITLLDEYDNLFGEAHVSPDMYMESDESETGSEGSDVESYDDDDDYDYDYDEEDDYDDDDEPDESVEESDADEDDDLVREASIKTGSPGEYHVPADGDHNHSSPKSSDETEDLKVNQVVSPITHEVSHEDVRNSENPDIPNNISAGEEQLNKPSGALEGVFTDESTGHHTSSTNSANAFCMKKSVTMSNSPARKSRRRSKWGRTSARKNLSMESIKFSPEGDAEIGTFEDAKTELQNKFAEDVKENRKLQDDLQKQNRPPHVRHLAIEQDMASRQEQLLEEKNSCATLEAGLKLPAGVDIASIDDKVKADLEELALLEADLTSLEKKVNDLRMQLNLKNRPDTEVTATTQFGKSSKDSQLGPENENERKMGPTSLPCNNPQQNSSKKLGTRKEGGANPLTKLSFRSLNFIKDKGRELAHSALNPEKGRGSEFHQPQAVTSPKGSRGSELRPVSIPEKGKGHEFRQRMPSPRYRRGSELYYVSIPEKGKGYEFRQPLPSPGKSRGSETHSGSNPEKGKGLGSVFQITDQGSDKEGTSEKHLDRGKLEGHKPCNNVDKGR